MPSAADIAAYIGAAAWLPQIAGWVYRRAVSPLVRVIPERQVQLGFTTYGPIFNVRMALSADVQDAVIEHIEVTLSHEQGESHTLAWAGLRETFSEITDSAGNKQLVEKDQPAIAIKISTQLLLEKFVRFQDVGYHDRHRAKVEAAAAHQNYLRSSCSDTSEAGRTLLASREFHTLTEFYKDEFWWKAGPYRVTFAIKSSNRAKLKPAVYEFSLAAHDVDALRNNQNVIRSDYSNLVLAGTEGYESLPVVWNWRTIPLRPIDTVR